MTAALGFSAGCSSVRDDLTPVCSVYSGDAWDVTAVFATSDADFVALRSETAPGSREVNDTTIRGVACAGATDPKACAQKLSELRRLDACGAPSNAPGYFWDWNGTCALNYVIFTRGDEVGAAVTDAEVARLLGGIDSRDKAVYLMTRNDYQAGRCDRNGGPRAKADEGSWFVEYDLDDCTKYERVSRVVRISADGRMEEVDRTIIEESITCSQ